MDARQQEVATGQLTQWPGPRRRQAASRQHGKLLYFPGARPRPLRIVIAGGAGRYRSALARRLEVDGHCVTQAEDLAAALPSLVRGACDLVCIDWDRPARAAPTITRRVRRRLPDSYLVLLAGFADRLDERQARLLGVDVVLPKPCTPSELAYVLGRASARQESRPTRGPSAAG